MMLDLHIEGAAPVTLLVRDESRSTRSTSVNKEDDLDPLLDFQDASFSSAASPPMHDKGKQRQQLLTCSNRNRIPLLRASHSNVKIGFVKVCLFLNMKFVSHNGF